MRLLLGVALLASLSRGLAQDTEGDDITNPSPNNFILEYDQVSNCALTSRWIFVDGG
jgi:hypothetical protein